MVGAENRETDSPEASLGEKSYEPFPFFGTAGLRPCGKNDAF